VETRYPGIPEGSPSRNAKGQPPPRECRGLKSNEESCLELGVYWAHMALKVTLVILPDCLPHIPMLKYFAQLRHAEVFGGG